MDMFLLAFVYLSVCFVCVYVRAYVCECVHTCLHMVVYVFLRVFMRFLVDATLCMLPPQSLVNANYKLTVCPIA